MNEYQTNAAQTAVYQSGMKSRYERLNYTTLGLVSEAGEVAGKLKKIYRDNGGYIGWDEKEALVSELGDVLWYVAMSAYELGVDLESVARKNLMKLALRKTRGTLQGSGGGR